MSRQSLRLLVAIAAMQALPGVAQAENLPWDTFPPRVGHALYAFRQTGHPIAEAARWNMDRNDLGREREGGGRPLNFNPASHLFWIVTDFNRDRQTEVFLLFQWSAITGNNPPEGVIMQQIGERWRVACDFQHEPRLERRGVMRNNRLVLLDQRTHGWRHFRVFSGTYGWKRSPEGEGAMNCVWLGDAGQ